MVAFKLVKVGRTNFRQEEDDVQPPGLDMRLTFCKGL